MCCVGERHTVPFAYEYLTPLICTPSESTASRPSGVVNPGGNDNGENCRLADTPYWKPSTRTPNVTSPSSMLPSLIETSCESDPRARKRPNTMPYAMKKSSITVMETAQCTCPETRKPWSV